MTAGWLLALAHRALHSGEMPPSRAASRRDDVADGRDETVAQRADRNWNEVLQELRVLQTGTQILTGFLLALAFQPAFADLSGAQVALYLTLVVLAALATIAALAPVALHRALFRGLVKRQIVMFGHVALITSLVTVGLLLIGVVAFVFDVVLDASAAVIIAVVLVALIASAWVVIPLVVRARAAAKAAAG